jgi:hypothetical protein
MERNYLSPPPLKLCIDHYPADPAIAPVINMKFDRRELASGIAGQLDDFAESSRIKHSHLG